MLHKVDLSTKQYFAINVPDELTSDEEINEHIKLVITKNINSLISSFDKNFKISLETLDELKLLQ